MLRNTQALAKIMAVLALVVAVAFMNPMFHLPGAYAGSLTGWHEQDSGTTSALSGVSALDANTAWAVGTGGTIIKTTDGGDTWEPQDSGTTVALLSITAVDANTAWVVGESGTILKTANGGDTWTPQASGTTSYLNSVSAVDTSTAWIVGDFGTLLKTTNGGASWNPQDPGVSYIRAVSAVDASTAWIVGRIALKTIDGGNSWNPQATPSGVSLTAVSAVDASNAWAVGVWGVIVHTDDGGATWELQEADNTETLYGVSAVDSNTAFAVGGIGGMTQYKRVILKTSDGGSLWETQVSELDQGLYDVAAVNGNTAWAVGDLGTILHTTGGGQEYSFYFAEGYTGSGFQEYLCLGNTEPETAQVVITFMFPDGQVQEERLEVPPSSRATVNVNQVVGEDREVSARVVSDKMVVAERPMYFNYNGAWTGGHDVIGASSPAAKWYFAEGYTGAGFDEWVCVLNPGDVEAKLFFYFQTQEEGEKNIRDISVPPHSRETFKVNDLLGGKSYQTSLKLESTQPIVAERPMYFNYKGQWAGGHCVMGNPNPGFEYYFAEGTTRAGFDEWLCIQNPLDTSTTVSATYLLGEGQGDPIERTYEVQPLSRYTVFVPDEVEEGKDVSIALSGDHWFLAERPTYFSYSYGGLSTQGGTCVIGAASPAAAWYLAEGYTGAGFNQWICMQNPGDGDAIVEVIYYTQEAGALAPRTVTIPAGTRTNIMVNEDAGSGYQLAAGIRVISGPSIVVERPMYFSYGPGWTGGHDVLGYAP